MMKINLIIVIALFIAVIFLNIRDVEPVVSVPIEMTAEDFRKRFNKVTKDLGENYFIKSFDEKHQLNLVFYRRALDKSSRLVLLKKATVRYIDKIHLSYMYSKFEDDMKVSNVTFIIALAVRGQNEDNVRLKEGISKLVNEAIKSKQTVQRMKLNGLEYMASAGNEGMNVTVYLQPKEPLN